MTRENSYATLDADGQVPLDQLDNVAGGGPHNHAGEDITSGTVADARVAATLARDSEVTSAVTAHEALSDPHTGYVREADASWVDLTDSGATTLHSHAGSGAPADADYLVGTAHAGLSAEIVVGATPGGELGNTWASPTVDATHSGSTHAATQAAAEATAAGALSGHAADTTAIHGIADTSVLATATDVSSAVSAHTGDATDAHDASAVSFAPAGAIAATDVQAAIEELDTEKSGTGHSHSTDFGEVGDIAASAFGDTAAAGATGEVADAGHRHAREADPVTAHAAAGDPHPGYLTSAEGDAAYEATGAVSTHAGLADPHTGYRLESADHSHASTGLQAGTVAHTALTSVGIDDHHARDHAINGATHTGTLDDAQIPAGIARDAEVTSAVSAEATARDAAITTHAGLADPHSGYRLESADHTHATTGAQAGQVAHSALSGITANDHHAQAHAADHLPTGTDPVNKFSQAGIGTADLAIANTETVVVSKVFAANELVAGATYMFKAYATRAGTTSASPIIRIRIGTTTLTGNIAATLTPPVNTLAVPNSIEGMVTIRSAGAGGTALGSVMHTVHLAAVTITEAVGVSTATVAVDTTAANQRIELTFISGNAANTYTWRNAVIYRVA